MPINLTPEEDLSLLERIERRDNKAVALLYDRHSGIVYSMALRVLRNPALAEQILTEIFLEIWHSPTRFMKIAGNLPFSMAMIARNRAVAMLLHKPASDFDFAFPDWLANRQQRNIAPEEASLATDRLSVEHRNMVERAFFGGADRSSPDGQSSNLKQTDGHASEAVSRLAGTGLEVIDVQSDPAFAKRQLHVRDVASHAQGMGRLARAFVESPAKILQELVDAAVELCGADSAGISVVQNDSTDDNFYHWVATAGQYSGFLGAKLPRYPSACGVTLERGRPQIFRVTQRFFDLMGIQAPTVTDGLLLPWQVEETRGTIWIMAHDRDEAFDAEDCRMMEALANFAATGVKLERQQKLLLERTKTAAQAAMANEIAHEIDNPLRELMHAVFLFDRGGLESGAFAQQAMKDVARLSDVAERLLSFPG